MNHSFPSLRASGNAAVQDLITTEGKAPTWGTPSPPRLRGPRKPPAPLKVREGNGGQILQEDTRTHPGPTPTPILHTPGYIQLLEGPTLDKGPGATLTKSHTRGGTSNTDSFTVQSRKVGNQSVAGLCTPTGPRGGFLLPPPAPGPWPHHSISAPEVKWPLL